MLIRLSTSLLWHGRAYYDGDEIDMPDEIAERYVATRQADRVDIQLVEAMAVDTKQNENAMRKHQPQLRRR